MTTQANYNHRNHQTPEAEEHANKWPSAAASAQCTGPQATSREDSLKWDRASGASLSRQACCRLLPEMATSWPLHRWFTFLRAAGSGAACKLMGTYPSSNDNKLHAPLHLTCNNNETSSSSSSPASHRKNSFHKQQHKSSLLASILLPLLCMFLLPSLKLIDIPHHPKGHNCVIGTEPRGQQELPASPSDGPSLPVELLLAPLREVASALARLRLVSSAGASLGAEAKDTKLTRRQDLQEEETHMQMLMPAEHRHLYAGSGSGQSMVSRSSPQRASELATAYAPAESAGMHPGESTAAVAPADYGLASDGQAEGGPLGSVEGTSVAEPASHLSPSGAGLQTRGDLPAVRALNVKCEKNHMTVNIVFDRPFYGMVFSKGHYNDQKCVHLPANSGQTSVNFDIHLGKCGMSSSDASGNTNAAALQQQQQQQQQLAATNGQPQQPNGLYIENTIIIQYDPQVQEIYDQARKLRCTWYDYYEKSVTFRPYNVDMLDAVTANFLGDNIQCWMQIQVGKGPWSSEVAGIVKIGQTMTMVLAIKDDENRFDMLVRNCVAHDGKHQPIQLVDEYGCVARPKIMAKFQKVRNFGPAATVVSYAHFQAFKFPDSMSVHFQCVIQVCRYECPEPVCGSGSGGSASAGSAAASEAIAGQAAGGDYTASGTEIVSSKEPLPVGHGGSYHFIANNSMGPAAAGASHGNSVNLKLDESQGRVQVKLDTSMMAGAGRMPSSATAGGPLPPHLLHTAASSPEGPAPVPPGYIPARPSTANHLNSAASYYKPQVTAAGGSGLLLPGGGQRHPSGLHLSHSQGGATNGRPSMLNVRAQLAPPAHRSSNHFSSPYSHQPAQQQHQPQTSLLTHRVYATNRFGELPPAEQQAQQTQQQQQASTSHDNELLPATQSTSVDSELGLLQQQQPAPLSLIAVPRGLRTSHRQRRSVLASNGTGSEALHLLAGGLHHPAARSINGDREDSTSIRTQKTIQVVSPDDVAFSLLDDDDDAATGQYGGPLIGVAGGNLRRQQSAGASTVCFSATRLIVAVLVTVAALAAGLITVAYLVMRQRANQASDSDKLSSLYEPEDTMTAAEQLASCQYGAAAAGGYRQQHPAVCRQLAPEMEPTDAYDEAMQAANMICHRQREEIQQRNNYLARLYSQFSPANYWR